MTDLFATTNPAAPLADRLRPKTIHDVIGQRHLLAPGKPLASPAKLTVMTLGKWPGHSRFMKS